MPEVLRYTAFSDTPDGGNPAGVVLDAGGLSAEEMLSIAADLGYSESAFLTPRGDGRFAIRYFSPLAEVPFCGHATIATGVAWAERNGDGEMRLDTQAGEVVVRVGAAGGVPVATLTSVAPSVADPEPGDVDEALGALGWSPGDLGPALPPRVPYAGAHHLVLAAATRERLADLDYDFDRLGALMARRDWTTVQLVWRERDDVFHARDPFPPGGIVEDPATGAAAAALGAYLRELGLVAPPVRVTVHQGHDMGRPALLHVDILAEPGSGISVSGTAVAI